MARILAIDTTGEFGSLALLEESELIEQVPLHSPDGFGHVLFGHLQRLISRHQVSLESIDCFAAASGPGSFTGVRIGLTAVKGLGESTAKPVVAVSNLKALAWHGTAATRAVFMDARRGQVYAALYSASLDLVAPECVAKLPVWLDALPAGEKEFITTDALLMAEARLAPRTLAEAVAHIADVEFAAGRAQDPAAIDANYVRRSDAELLWKE